MPDSMSQHVTEESAQESTTDQSLEMREETQRRSGEDRRDTEIENKTFLNRHIFREHEVGDHAFIIKSGIVEIYLDTDDGKVVIGTLEKDAMFGEMALIDDRPRMASAMAVGPVSVMVISRDMIDRKISNSDPFVRGLIQLLLAHARCTVSILV